MSKVMYKIDHMKSYGELLTHLHNHIGNIENKIVLEAGCGSSSNIKFNNCEIYGLDISQSQLEKNKIIKYKIVGDLNKYSNKEWEKKFDLIICWDVLEHLNNPSYAIKNFANWLKNNGEMILAFPIPDTIIGKITKYSPLWVHYIGRVLTYLKYEKNDNIIGYWRIAKKSTFPTVYNKILKIDSLLQFLETLELKIELILSTESGKNQIIRSLLGKRIYMFFHKRIRNNSITPLSPLATDLVLYLKK